MKPELHPVYPPSRIVCACGNTIETRSTRGSFHVEICSNCHPFFTGKYKLVDTAGRIDRFKKKYGNRADLVKDDKPGEAPKATEKKVEAKKAGKTEKAPKKAAEVEAEAEPKAKA